MLPERNLKAVGKHASWEVSKKLEDGDYTVKVKDLEFFQREINGENSWAATDQNNTFTVKSLIGVGLKAKINRANFDLTILEMEDDATLNFNVKTLNRTSQDGTPYEQKVYTKLS